MRRERVHRARRRIVLCVALLIPWTQPSHATDALLYARAIGDPYLPAPAVDAPRSPASRADPIPELPTLGGAPTDPTPTAAVETDGWSWKRILIGAGVAVAIAAIASKGGGSSGDDGAAPPASGSPPPSSGGGSPPPGSGGGGVTPPTPPPVPPTPTPPPPSHDDDDDDDDKKKGKGRRIFIPSFSASF